MSFEDPEDPFDGDNHDRKSNDNMPMLLALFGAGILILIVLLYFAY